VPGDTMMMNEVTRNSTLTMPPAGRPDQAP
jgi:hypothetical protein